MTIEQKFLEAFGVEKIKREYVLECIDCSKCVECNSKERWYFYPPITPEIVLELENIIIKMEKTVSLILTYDDIPKNIIQSEKMYKYTFNGIERWTSNWDKIRKNALLLLCIQLKDEIQDQVRALFNAM